MNLNTNGGDKERLIFQVKNQPAVAIMPSMRDALVTAECDVEGDSDRDRGLLLCEEHLDALQQGCVLAVYLPSGHKLFIRYKPEHPPRTW